MCGIFGHISQKPVADEEILNALSRRGPDGRGKVTIPLKGDGTVLTMLHTRLSIIDLSDNGRQPMWDSKERYVIVLNGEIYNYESLRNELTSKGHTFRTLSDTEVILNGYAEWGGKVVEHLRGMFAFALFDTKSWQLVLARDPFGIKPLYLYRSSQTFYFSSTIEALLQAGFGNFSLSSKGVKQYLVFGSCLAPQTILNEVEMLLPGHMLTIDADGESRVEQYYDLKQQKPMEFDETRAKAVIRDAMIDSVQNHLVADVPVGVFLSSGIDSTLIASIAASLRDARIHTYTVRINASGRIHDESLISATTARRINSIHETVEIGVNALEEVLDDFICALDVPSIDGLNTFLISKAVRQRTKVVLSGLGGDELFGGYPVFHEAYRLAHPKLLDHILHLLPRPVLYKLHIQHLQYWGKQVREIALDKRIVGTADDEVLSSVQSAFIENEDLARAITQFEMSHYLRNTLLRDTDAVTLHNSLECRVPFVDKVVYETAMSIATDLKLGGTENKALLVDAFRDMLPDDIARSPKHGFVLPLVEWTRQYLTPARTGELRKVAQDHRLPLSDRAFDGRKVSMKHYQWLILLKWIKKHENYLSSGPVPQ